MIEKLDQIATDVGNLRTANETLPADDRLLIDQLIDHLQWALTDLSERPGMLTGPMPWWTSRKAAAS